MLVEAGFETTLLCWDRERECPKCERLDGYEARRCHLRAPYGNRWLFLLTPLWWVYELVFLLTHRADCIHACDFDTIVPALCVKLLKRVPVVYDIYDLYSVKSATIPGWLRGVFAKAERVCARRADAVVIVDDARRYLLGPREPRRVVVAMNCPYDAVEPEWHKPDNEHLVIFYGGLIGRYRGIEKLARVTAGLEDVRVVIAGWVTDEECGRLARESPHIDFVGTIDYDEALRHTFNADAVYSYYDPALEINRTANSSKMYDALMCGTAVLANREPPAAQIVEEYDCGALLPYDDDEALRDTIVTWRDDRALVRRLGANGREAFESSYNWPRMAERILGVYAELGLLPGDGTP